MTGNDAPASTFVGVRHAVFAHRGGSVGAPNTPAAVRCAIDAGAHGVEIDIQLAKGGELVAKHDPGADLDAEDLPNLADMLAVVDETGVRLLIDFKSSGEPDREARLLSVALTGVARPELIAVSSFSISFLDRFQELCPSFPLYPIVSLRQNFLRPPDFDRWAGASVLAGALVVNPYLWFSLKRRNRSVIVWFGSTEWWPWLIRSTRRFDIDAIIVANVARTAQLIRGKTNQNEGN